jgi:hypothetical protein
MLNLLATLVVTALPAPSAVLSTCPDPTPATAEDVGECGEAAPLDLWYRMSRFADGERDPGAAGAAPARRPQTNRSGAACDAPQTPVQLPAPLTPPAALFALPVLLPLQIPSHFDADAHALPARALAPPERPPRA